jgi:hypothetical protein
MSSLEAKRALEALRNGVPNSFAVRALGCMQPEALDAFSAQLDRLATAGAEPPVVRGTLLVGGFGAGKSHTLAYLQQEALQRGFVVSRLVISKETPLHDPARLFVAVAREARLPDGRGSALHELAGRLDYRSPSATPFVEWALRRQPLGIVAATVAIHERTTDPELAEKIVQFWSGDRLGVTEVRAALRDLDLARAYEVRAAKVRQLAPVRTELAARLARAAGLAGWVVLFDEVELVGRYSLLQRAKAYAELARWLGAVPAQGVPGVAAVAAITDDFAAEVLGRRDDLSRVPERLRARGDDESLRLAALAEAGMALVDRGGIALHRPNDDTLAATWRKLRDLYEAAYGWRPPDGYQPPGGRHRTMRSHVRHWIAEWDLERLWGREATIEESELPPSDYTEDSDLTKDDDSDGPEA